MKNTKQKSLKRNALILSVCLLTVAVFAFLAIPRNNKKVALPPISAPKYSDEEMHKFWNLHLEKLIRRDLVGGKYAVSSISYRYRTLFNQIVTRYGKQFSLMASTIYNVESPANVAGVDANGDPTVLIIFVPSFIDMYTLLKNSRRPTWEKEFEVFVIACVMHELEHIAYHSSGRTPSKKQMIDEETKAWTATCMYTLSAFVEAGYPLDPNNSNYFQGWINCNGDQNCFGAFVANGYANIMDKR